LGRRQLPGTAAHTFADFGATDGNPALDPALHAASHWQGKIRVEISAAHGRISLSRIAGLTFFAGDGVADAFVTAEGHVADVNRALDGAVYRPDIHWNTRGRPPETVTIRASN
ncbi:unnamed protein product, partial [Phaeothamnion confervicola]